MTFKQVGLAVFGIILAFILVFVFIYSSSYRRLPFKEMYPYDDPIQKIIGKKYISIPDSYYMVSKANPDNFMTVPREEADKNYNKDQYDLTFIPEATVLRYAMGFFVGLEEIPDTDDFYLLLDQGEDGIEKYRFVSENRPVGKMVKSIIRVEDFNLIDRLKQQSRRAETTNIEFDVNKIKRLLRVGDFIVVHPDYLMDVVVERDDQGVIFIGDMVVKRSFGYIELVLESMFL